MTACEACGHEGRLHGDRAINPCGGPDRADTQKPIPCYCTGFAMRSVRISQTEDVTPQQKAAV